MSIFKNIKASETYNSQMNNEYKEILPSMISSLMADEFISCFQYRMSAMASKQNYKEAVINQFIEHSNDELKHFDMLVDLATKLGIEDKVNTEFGKLVELTNCQIDKIPTETTSNINIQKSGESCAIKGYRKLLTLAKQNKDSITCDVIRSIIADEVEHETDLEKFLN